MSRIGPVGGAVDGARTVRFAAGDSLPAVAALSGVVVHTPAPPPPFLATPPGAGRAGVSLRAGAALSVRVFPTAVLLPHFLATPPGADLGDVWPALFGHVGWQVLSNLSSGVFVFFVLSGYLISRPFVRSFVAGTPP